MFEVQSLIINLSEKDNILGDIRFPKEPKAPLPIVIITHGFTGHKDWGFIPYLAEQLAINGFISVAYNFSTDCVDPRTDLFTDVEKFASFTISQEVSELKMLIESISEGKVLPQKIKEYADTSQIYLIGQSLGGAVSIIYAAEYNVARKIVLLGTVGTLFRYTKRQVREWEKNGTWFFQNSRTGQELKINYTYYKDLSVNNYCLEEFLGKVNVPTMFIHGSEDFTVPKQEIVSLINKAKNPLVELKIIENTGHTFGIEHPFSKPTEALNLVLSETIAFLKR